MDLLNIDLFIHLASYLNLSDVVNLCQVNSKFHRYGIKYNNHWKFLIDKTYLKVYNYAKHLKDLTEYKGYITYVKLIDTFDPLSKLMFYYRRGDYKKFDCRSGGMLHKYLTLFLLGEKAKMKYYRSGLTGLFLERIYLDLSEINELLSIMCDVGSVEGIKYAIERGGTLKEFCLFESCIKGYYDTVKYLVKNGANLNSFWDGPTRYAATNGHLKILKYLVKKVVIFMHLEKKL